MVEIRREIYLGDEKIVVMELLLHFLGKELLHDGRLQLLVRGLPNNWYLKIICVNAINAVEYAGIGDDWQICNYFYF